MPSRACRRSVAPVRLVHQLLGAFSAVRVSPSLSLHPHSALLIIVQQVQKQRELIRAHVTLVRAGRRFAVAAESTSLVFAIVDRPSTTPVLSSRDKNLARRASPIGVTSAFKSRVCTSGGAAAAGGDSLDADDLMAGVADAADSEAVYRLDLFSLWKLTSLGSNFTLTTFSRWWSLVVVPALRAFFLHHESADAMDVQVGRDDHAGASLQAKVPVIAISTDNTTKEVRNASFMAGVARQAAVTSDYVGHPLTVVIIFKTVGHGHDSLDSTFAAFEAKMRASTTRLTFEEYLDEYMAAAEAATGGKHDLNVEFGWRVPDLSKALLDRDDHHATVGITKAHSVVIDARPGQDAEVS